MATLAIDIPDDFKERCKKTLVGQTIATVTRRLREALEQEAIRLSEDLMSAVTP